MGAASPLAWAQSAANQGPLKLIVPFTPGTGIDLIARTLGPKLSQRLNRPVVVENRVGASGNIGTEAVVRSAPDGST
ncbi:MAG: tripartite tricarboxylate transporter substrate-binding protein, partial [Limnohabitans sp.]